eukprot:2658318-Rhodomonas_salina.5
MSCAASPWRMAPFPSSILPPPYAMSATDLRYAATRRGLVLAKVCPYALPTQCPVSRNAVGRWCVRSIGKGSSPLYAPTRSVCRVRYWPRISPGVPVLT